ncbi:hypothetical protein F4778DRAFT_707002 [Xylariomycetidae sp. FL2044]|nr:hypothetical protein F4778DRAFT_707002 [Xylariomycetidae sp. FL2044]
MAFRGWGGEFTFLSCITLLFIYSNRSQNHILKCLVLFSLLILTRPGLLLSYLRLRVLVFLGYAGVLVLC